MYSIIFLHEIYSTFEVKNISKSQWKGKPCFLISGGAGEYNERCVNMTNKSLNYFQIACSSKYFIFSNVYVPNKVSEQCFFFSFMIKFKMRLLI